jgi:hypothetical protein
MRHTTRDDRESRPAPAHTRIKLSWTANRTTGYTAIVTLGDLARALLADQEPSDPNTAAILDDILCQPGRKLAALLAKHEDTAEVPVKHRQIVLMSGPLI